MHLRLLNLIKKVGIPTSSRSCGAGFLWDGDTLALNQPVWDDSLKTYLEDKIKPLEEDRLIHEVAHWVVASPIERQFPEYGCRFGAGLGTIAPEGLPFRYWDNVLTKEEQDFREICAQFLATYWREEGIIFSHLPEPFPFRCVLRDDVNSEVIQKYIEMGWQAIAWLRENEIIPSDWKANWYVIGCNQ